MAVYDDNLVIFPELDDIGEWLNNNFDGFLSSIYNNSKKWNLSDKQIYLAQKKWDDMKDPPIIIDISYEQRKLLISIIHDFIPANYYNKQTFLRKMSYELVSGEITNKQYDLIIKSIYKYRKSILKKIFK